MIELKLILKGGYESKFDAYVNRLLFSLFSIQYFFMVALPNALWNI